MNGQERRNEIISKLKDTNLPVSASRLAEDFSVTRQIIVTDIALLRTAGYNIRAEHKGYVLDKASDIDGIRRLIVVKHDKEAVRDEFYAVVDNGGKVLDVIVVHPIYGTISVKLDIATRYDADMFVSRISETGAAPLSALTEGLHIHTVSAKDEGSFDRIINRLKELNVYIESN